MVKVKCRGHPKKSWVTGIELLKKELDLQNKVFDIKQILNTTGSSELKESEMVLQHKSKLHNCKGLKEVIGFEEYLEYVKVAHARFFSFVPVPISLLKSCVGMLIRVCHRNVLIVVPLNSQLSMFCLNCVS